MAYALKLGQATVPLTRFVSPETLIAKGRNTIVVERDEQLRAHVFELFATNHSPQSAACSLPDLLCCLLQIQAPQEWNYRKSFAY